MVAQANRRWLQPGNTATFVEPDAGQQNAIPKRVNQCWSPHVTAYGRVYPAREGAPVLITVLASSESICYQS